MLTAQGAKAVCSSPESSKKRLRLFWNSRLLRISRAASQPLQLFTAHEALLSQRFLEHLLRAGHEDANGPESLPSWQLFSEQSLVQGYWSRPQAQNQAQNQAQT